MENNNDILEDGLMDHKAAFVALIIILTLAIL